MCRVIWIIRKFTFYELDFLEKLIKILITTFVKVKLDVEAKNFLAQNWMFFPLFLLKYQEFPSCWHLLNLVMKKSLKIGYVSFIFQIFSISVGFHEVKTFTIMDEFHQGTALAVF